MVDQDKAPTYEAGLPQTPVNLDSKVPIHMARKSGEGADRISNGGYYSNVAQKGKLILPTALWILLVIGGICFLTLLAMLNKTIGTLDTLVELEQEKEARALVGEHLHHRQLHKELNEQSPSAGQQKEPKHKKKKKGHKSERKQSAEQMDAMDGMAFKRLNDELISDSGAADDPVPVHGWPIPIEASWFSMPSWASLEPIRREPQPAHYRGGSHQHGPPPPSPMGLFEDLMRGLPAPDTIIIQSEPDDQPPDGLGLFGSLMDQMSPIFGRFVAGDEPASAKAPSRADAGDEQPAMISAKIDNLNVHINPAPSQGAPEDRKQTREEEINSLEKSIDDLVGRLMDQKMPAHKGANELRPFADILPPNGNHEVQHRRPATPPLSPLANLLLRPPLQKHEPGSMFIQTFGIDEPQDMGPEHGHGPRPGPGSASDAHLIISIGDGPEMVGKPSRETTRHQVSNTRRPSFGQSPYELPPFSADDLMKNPAEIMSMIERPPSPLPLPLPPPHDPSHRDHQVSKADKPIEAPWDMFANDLAQVLVEDMMNRPHGPEGKADKFHERPPMILIEDGTPFGPFGPFGPPEPLGMPPIALGGENLVPTIEMLGPFGPRRPKAKSKDKKQPSDLFSTFFAPKAASKLVASKTKHEHPKENPAVSSIRVEEVHEPKGPPTKNVGVDQAAKQNSSTNPTTSQPIEPTSEPPLDGPKMSPEAKAKVDSLVQKIQASEPMTSQDGDFAHNDAKDMLSDFVGTMFTLPQMGGSNQQASLAEAKPASGGAAGK